MSERIGPILRYTMVVSLAALFLQIPALGQVAGIRGEVRDPTGTVIPDVNVAVTNVASGVITKVTTTKAGFTWSRF